VLPNSAVDSATFLREHTFPLVYGLVLSSESRLVACCNPIEKRIECIIQRRTRMRNSLQFQPKGLKSFQPQETRSVLPSNMVDFDMDLRKKKAIPGTVAA